jgi:hypothetical protein
MSEDTLTDSAVCQQSTYGKHSRYYFWRVSLDHLIANPLRVNELPRDEQRKLLMQLPPVQTALAAAILVPPEEHTIQTRNEPDEWLTVAQVADILKVTVRWVYEHSKDLPFAVKISHKNLRFSKLGLFRWMSKG